YEVGAVVPGAGMVVAGFGPPREYGTVPGGVAAAWIIPLARASELLGPVTSELGNVVLAGPNPVGIGLFGPTYWIFPGRAAASPAGGAEPPWRRAVGVPTIQRRIVSAAPILTKVRIDDSLFMIVHTQGTERGGRPPLGPP